VDALIALWSVVHEAIWIASLLLAFLEAVRDDNVTPLPKAAVLGLSEMLVVLQNSAMAGDLCSRAKAVEASSGPAAMAMAAHLTPYSHGTSPHPSLR
jgi:hypothetical protein